MQLHFSMQLHYLLVVVMSDISDVAVIFAVN